MIGAWEWYVWVITFAWIAVWALAIWKGVILPGLELFWHPKSGRKKLWVMEACYGRAEVARALRCIPAGWL